MQDLAPHSPPENTMSSIPATESRERRDTTPRVRRRNRMITSCLECRRRKLKCDKQSPCTNCTKFSRECNFLAPALDSVSQKKLNEIKDKMGSLERTLEEDVARRAAGKRDKVRKGSLDLPGEGSESDDGAVPEDEKGLEATPLATIDGAYEDDASEDILDLGFRVGKFRMTERLGGLFRPKIAEEMVFALVRDNKQGTEQEAPLADNHDTFLDPGPTFLAPGSGFIYGDVGPRRNLVDFLPTKAASEILLQRYYEKVHFVARVVHWPSLQVQFDNFWTSILSGVEPAPSLQSIMFAIMFSALTAMTENEITTIFQASKRQVVSQFQTGTEVALAKAHFLRTTKFETLQAIIIYLIPMCRDEVSRAHSVLVGAAVRLGECFGLHRDPVDVYGMQPIEAHVRRIAWFQLCFLDFRTAEAQGPRPQIKREDYDTKLPWNLDDIDLLTFRELQDKENAWTDMTLCRLRFECVEMQRIVWHDRARLDKQKVSITHCLGKIESFRKAMGEKYQFLDENIPIQLYAKLVLEMLSLRMHVMILHKFHNATATRIPDRLRQIIITSGTQFSESAVRLEREPIFAQWRWNCGSYQQWHTAFLLLMEVYMYPNRREANRIWAVCDYAFEPDLTLSRAQKARSIMAAVRDRAAAYRNLRKMREPVSMQNRLATRLPARGKIRGPDLIVPKEEVSKTAQNSLFQYTDHGLAMNPTAPEQAPTDNNATHAAASDTTWTMDSPYTAFSRPVDWQTNSMRQFERESGLSSSASPHTGQYDMGASPGSSSNATDLWPPVSSGTAWRIANPISSPSNPSLSSPPSQILSGNSAMGVVSGQYIPDIAQPSSQSQHLSPQQQYASPPNTNELLTKMQLGQNEGIGWGPQQQQGEQDQPMLDIDWGEWDKLFPPAINSGNLDTSSVTSGGETNHL